MKHPLSATKRTLAALLLAACCVGAAVAPAAAQASESRFYFEGHLGTNQAVSGTPRSNLWFAAGYTGENTNFCVGALNHSAKRICFNNVTSVTYNFGEFIEDRAWLENAGPNRVFKGEERWG
jgi:opacity protein-like surface antigen